ncbi:MAG: FMN-binding protein [Lachnospiraceae bacterium]|nr:FMN-binding protein [Lachnospiraceae bacterium]
MQNENGVYRGSAQGFGGPVTVTLEIRDGAVSACAIDAPKETEGIGDRAVEQLKKEIVERNTIEVDAVSGATVTSEAVRKAAQQALAQKREPAEVHMKPGKYTNASKGYWGIWDLPVTVTVNETSLIGIEVPEKRHEHGETEVMLNCVKEKLIPRMILNQSVAVDAITGCTATSNAVKSAVEKSLQEALAAGGSDPSAIGHFRRRPEKTERGQTEEIECEILVVGLSTAGIMLMKKASELMLEDTDYQKRIRVFGIDKCGKIGGQSALAHEANAPNPPKMLEKVNGGKPLFDTEDYKKELLEHARGKDGTFKCKPELVDLYCRESAEAIDWLAFREGYTFGTLTHKTDFSSNHFQSIWNYFARTGIDHHIESYEDRRNVIDSYMKRMLAEVCAAGGGYLLETEAYQYLQDETGAVTGVRARNTVTGKEYVIHARAVVSNTGGFGQNGKLMENLLDQRWAGRWKQNGNRANDGKLFEAGLAIGAGTWNADMAPITMEIGLPRFMHHFPIHFVEGKITPRTGRAATWTYNDIPLWLCCSINSLAVDRTGRRFGNEYGIGNGKGGIDVPPNAWEVGPYFYSIWSQPQIDRIAKEGFTSDNVKRTAAYCQQGGMPKDVPIPVMQEAMDAAVEEGLAWKADTLEELALLTGMDPAVLTENVKRYNAFCAQEKDDDFGKEARYLCPVPEGPYYAIKAMPVMYGSGGGYDIDTKMRVLRKDGKTPIRGLYAIGQDSFGVILSNEKNYIGLGGVNQGWLIASAMAAAKETVAFVKENYGL